MVLCGLVALLWFVLPFWQIVAGMADGFMPFVVCWIFAGFFTLLGVGLYFCYRRTRSGEISPAAHMALWCYVVVSGVIVTAMALRILHVSFHHNDEPNNSVGQIGVSPKY